MPVRRSLERSLSTGILWFFGCVYAIGFKWWLEPLVDRISERKLRREIEKEFAFLFADFGAHFVPNERKQRRATTLTIATRALRLQLSSGRGEYNVLISPATGNYEWIGLCDALRAIETERSAPEPLPFSSLSRVSAILEPRFARLEYAYGDDQYPLTKLRVEQIKADHIAEMKREVATTLAERAHQTTLIQQVLIEADDKFQAAQAERIIGLFEVFSEFRWNGEQERRLRSGLNETLRPIVGPVKATEITNRLIKLRETHAA